MTTHHRCLWWCGSLWRFPPCVSGADVTLQTSNTDVTLYNLTNESASKHIISRLICPPYCCVPEVLITLINVNTTSAFTSGEANLMYTRCINCLLWLYVFLGGFSCFITLMSKALFHWMEQEAASHTVDVNSVVVMFTGWVQKDSITSQIFNISVRWKVQKCKSTNIRKWLELNHWYTMLQLVEVELILIDNLNL